MNNYVCPECKGARGEYHKTNLERDDIHNPLSTWIDCFYCSGTGYASDEDEFEEIIRWEK